MRTRGAELSLGMAGLLAGTLEAQIGLSLRASTLGAGAEISYRPGRFLGLRGGWNYLRFTRTADIEGISYELTPRFETISGIVDLHPFGGSFHLSGGVFRNSNRGDVLAELNGPITIGNATYQPSEVGTLAGRVAYSRKYAPYAGLGFGGRSRVSFLFDVGLLFSGYPTASLTASSNLTGQARTVFDQNVQQEVDEIQGKIEDQSYLNYHPVVSLGLRVRF